MTKDRLRQHLSRALDLWLRQCHGEHADHEETRVLQIVANPDIFEGVAELFAKHGLLEGPL